MVASNVASWYSEPLPNPPKVYTHEIQTPKLRAKWSYLLPNPTWRLYKMVVTDGHKTVVFLS